MAMPPPPPGWYEPPKPEKGLYKTELYVTLVIVIVVILISVGLFAYLYITIPEPTDGWIAEPNVQFSAAEASGPNEWMVQVAGVSEAERYDSFQAILLRNGALQGEAMNPLQVTTVGNITFTDLDGGGRLSVGDYFTIATWPGGSYELSVIYRESGNVRGSEEWET
jgi:hypothetical protein